MIKDLLVPITDTPGDVDAVAAASAIAQQHGAHLALLEFVNLPIPVAGPWGGGELALGGIYNTFREQAQKDVAAWKERLAKQAPDVASEIRLVESFVSDSPSQAAVHARYADLSVMAMATDPARDGAPIREFFSALLLQSGRPVLLVPAGAAWREPQHIVVAWQPRREATRALHDAMPFLHKASSVDIVEIGDDRDEEGPTPGADVAAHLARHGFNARAVLLPAARDAVASTLIAHAQAIGADLIVAGGYGHSRFREWVMGGVTAELLATPCTIPILFSH